MSRLTIQFFTNTKGHHGMSHVMDQDADDGRAICGYYPKIGYEATTIAHAPDIARIECSGCLRQMARRFYSPEGTFIG